MFHKIWSILLFTVALLWFVDMASVVMGDRTFSPVTLFVAFATSGAVVFKWAVEAWQNKF